MSTKIEWTDETWNPITGCSPISSGCANCYAERMANRLRGRCGYSQLEPFRVTHHPSRIYQPKRWKKPRRVFVCSMGDLFHPGIENGFRHEVFDVMEACPAHQFQVLTKRPHFMRNFITLGRGGGVPSNVMFGVSVEKQVYARERLPILAELPAAERFISCEPLLGPIELTPWLDHVSWVIVGAETGPKARYMAPEWAMNIRDQCRRHGVQFFFKRDSYGSRGLDGQLYEGYPDAKR